MGKFSLLVIDDDREMTEMLRDALSRDYDVDTLSDSKEAESVLKAKQYDIVLTDLKMGEVDGFSILKMVKEISPETEVIIMTAFGTLETAIQAIKEGAFDYITKPFKISGLRHTLQKAIERKQLEKENLLLKKILQERYQFYNIIGKSSKMQRIFDLIEKISKVDSNVLIEGESGTGKELVAKAIHFNSPRKKGPFVTINCAAIPDNLLESELFGYVKGAFTGATQSKKGLFLEADGGTIFLDEIGDMSLNLQSKLLRVLEEKQIRPLGSTQLIPINVRIIAATNQNLKKAVEEKKFREDLYYRLNVINVSLPPLRERKEDIPLLVEHFIKKYADRYGKRIKRLDPRLMSCLEEYSWPGNVRELENAIERAVALTDDEEVIKEIDIPMENCHLPVSSSEPILVIDRIITLEELERVYIKKVLELTGGNKGKAAELLGISKRTIYRKEI